MVWAVSKAVKVFAGEVTNCTNHTNHTNHLTKQIAIFMASKFETSAKLKDNF